MLVIFCFVFLVVVVIGVCLVVVVVVVLIVVFVFVVVVVVIVVVLHTCVLQVLFIIVSQRLPIIGELVLFFLKFLFKMLVDGEFFFLFLRAFLLRFRWRS